MTTPLVMPDASVWLRIEEDSGVGTARRAAQQLCARLGFGEGRSGEVALAVTELGTNLIKHAGHGTMLLRPLHRDPVAVEVLAYDSGPGIPDVPAALRDGVSSAATLGIGLGALTRLADSWDIYTGAGGGTVVHTLYCARPSLGRPSPPRSSARVAALVRPMTGEVEAGDTYAWKTEGSRWHVLLVDGLGHGPLAARAARQAVRVFEDLPADTSPGAVLSALHRGLAATRGAAAAVVNVDIAERRLVFAGVGNVAGWIVDHDRRRGLVSTPGILGHQTRTAKEFAVDLAVGASAVLHTDGVTDKWSTRDYPGVLSHAPMCLAAVLLRDRAVRRDDAGVVVVRAV